MNYLIRENFIRQNNNRLYESFSLKDNIKLFDANKRYDIFLSYHHNDIALAKSVYSFLRNQDLTVYADFIEPSFNRTIVDKKTAEKLCERINCCKVLIYIHSVNSVESKWCPWEIGLASGLKYFNCLILPIVENEYQKYDKQEYLGLYPYLTHCTDTKGNGPYFWVHNDDIEESIELKKWIKNK